MKKFISILTAAALTAGLAAFAAGCGGSGDADLENGTLSAKGYASLTEAATACVTEEIAGDTTAATYKSYTAERLLEDKEIEKLNITDEQRAKVTRAEEGKITYSVPDADGNAQEYTTDVILVNLGTEVSYYISEPEDGEWLTHSYFDKVNRAYYDNFTAKLSANMSTSTGGVTVTQTMEYELRYTGTELWLKMSIPSTVSPTAANQTIEIIGAEKDGGITVYLSANGSDFISQSTTEYSSMKDLLSEAEAEMEISSSLDHTYYCKTDFGFSIREDRIPALASAMFDGLPVDENTDYENMSLNFYVTDDVITSAMANCKLSVERNGQTVGLSANIVMQVSQVGTTEITLPENVIDGVV